jgi:hypothetical protein
VEDRLDTPPQLSLRGVGNHPRDFTHQIVPLGPTEVEEDLVDQFHGRYPLARWEMIEANGTVDPFQ